MATVCGMPVLRKLAAAALALLAAHARADTSQEWSCKDVPAQCKPYAELLAPLLATHAAWMAKGGITRELILDATHECSANCALLRLHGGQLYVVRSRRSFQTRMQATLGLLQRALGFMLALHGHVPDMEFLLNTSDFPMEGLPAWSYADHAAPEGGGGVGESPNWLIPDYSWYGWPDALVLPWAAQARVIMEAADALPWEQRDPRMVWRGHATLSNSRKHLVEKFGKRADIASVGALLTWPEQVLYATNATLREGLSPQQRSRLALPLQEFCKYRYIINADGTGYPARNKYHLLCGSFMIQTKQKWRDMYNGLVEEGTHYFTTDYHWNGLEDLYTSLQANTTLPQLARRAFSKFRRLLSDEGLMCYLRQTFACYKSAMQYKVVAPDPLTTLSAEYFLLGWPAQMAAAAPSAQAAAAPTPSAAKPAPDAAAPAPDAAKPAPQHEDEGKGKWRWKQQQRREQRRQRQQRRLGSAA